MNKKGCKEVLAELGITGVDCAHEVDSITDIIQVLPATDAGLELKALYIDALKTKQPLDIVIVSGTTARVGNIDITGKDEEELLWNIHNEIMKTCNCELKATQAIAAAIKQSDTQPEASSIKTGLKGSYVWVVRDSKGKIKGVEVPEDFPGGRDDVTEEYDADKNDYDVQREKITPEIDKFTGGILSGRSSGIKTAVVVEWESIDPDYYMTTKNFDLLPPGLTQPLQNHDLIISKVDKLRDYDLYVVLTDDMSATFYASGRYATDIVASDKLFKQLGLYDTMPLGKHGNSASIFSSTKRMVEEHISKYASIKTVAAAIKQGYAPASGDTVCLAGTNQKMCGRILNIDKEKGTYKVDINGRAFNAYADEIELASIGIASKESVTPFLLSNTTAKVGSINIQGKDEEEMLELVAAEIRKTCSKCSDEDVDSMLTRMVKVHMTKQAYKAWEGWWNSLPLRDRAPVMRELGMHEDSAYMMASLLTNKGFDPVLNKYYKTQVLLQPEVDMGLVGPIINQPEPIGLELALSPIGASKKNAESYMDSADGTSIVVIDDTGKATVKDKATGTQKEDRAYTSKEEAVSKLTQEGYKVSTMHVRGSNEFYVLNTDSSIDVTHPEQNDVVSDRTKKVYLLLSVKSRTIILAGSGAAANYDVHVGDVIWLYDDGNRTTSFGRTNGQAATVLAFADSPDAIKAFTPGTYRLYVMK